MGGTGTEVTLSRISRKITSYIALAHISILTGLKLRLQILIFCLHQSTAVKLHPHCGPENPHVLHKHCRQSTDGDIDLLHFSSNFMPHFDTWLANVGFRDCCSQECYALLSSGDATTKACHLDNTGIIVNIGIKKVS